MREDRDGSYSEVLTMSATPSLNGSDEPTGAEAVSGLQTLRRTHYNAAGQAISVDEYFSFASLTYSESASLGTEGTHFYRTTLAYDSRGRQHRVERPDGSIYRTVFDGLGRPVSEWIGDNDTPETGYWSPSNPADMVQVKEYQYDGGDVGDSLLTSVTDGLDHTTTLGYDFRGRLTSTELEDPDGGGSLASPVYLTSFDNLGRVIQKTDSLGNLTTYAYSLANSEVTVTLPDPDAGGPATSPVVVQGFSARGLATTQTDALGNETVSVFDGAGRLIQVTLPDPDSPGSGASSPVIEYAYDSVGNVRFTTDPLSHQTERQYDKANRLVKIIGEDPDAGGSQTSPETEFAYNAAGFLESQTDPLGNVTSFEYDRLGRTLVTVAPDPDGGGSQVSSEWTNTFDEVGRLLTTADPLSHVTEYQYDVFGRRTKIIDAEDGETDFTYDVVGNLLTLTDPVENTTTWEYDNLNRAIEETNELEDTRYFSYDVAGNLIKRVDRNNRKIEYVYDHLNRRTSERWGANAAFPAVSVSTTTEGGTSDEVQTVGFTTAMGVYGGTFTLTYSGQTTSTIAWNASAATVQTALEALSNIGSGDVAVTKLTNTNNSQTWQVAFQGALAGTNVAQITVGLYGLQGYSLSAVEATDAAGGNTNEVHVVTLSNATGGTFTLSFGGQTTAAIAYNASAGTVETALENLSTIDDIAVSGSAGGPYAVTFQGTHAGTNVAVLTPDFSALTGSNLERTLFWAYDANNRVTSASDPAAAYEYTYDNLGRRLSVVHDLAGLSFDVELTSAFDAASNRTDLSAIIDGTDDFHNDYLYDDLNRLVQILQRGEGGGNAVAEKRIDFAYDAANRWDTITRYADLAGLEFVADSIYTFDNAGRLTALTHAQDTTTLADYDWVYDAANRITAFTDNLHAVESAAYSYDETNQLTGADRSGSSSDEGFTYDANGNRTMSGYTTGDNNQLEADGTFTYDYDDEGNRTKKTNASTGAYVVYEWDHRNRLTAVRFKTAAHAIMKQVEYEYDVFNRRVVKRLDAAGDNTYESALRFVYDDSNVVLTFDESGDLANRYLHGPAVDQILASEDGGGDVLWPLADNQGTIRDLAEYNAGTDTSSVVKHLTYGAFGQILSDSDPTIDILFAYAGREWDPDAELYYYRARWYDPAVGKFLSEDPIGFSSSDVNIQRYVGNNPANFTDPTGLDGIGAFSFCRGENYLYATAKPVPPSIPGAPNISPGPGWTWKGVLPEGGPFGAWVHPDFGSLHWDPTPHGDIGPHWDWVDKWGNKWRFEPETGKWFGDKDNNDNKPTPDFPPGTLQTVGGAIGVGIIIYVIISEGSRLVCPPRNLIPVP